MVKCVYSFDLFHRDFGESAIVGNSEPYSRPHRRHNPLTGEWVLVSPHRTQRPWQGKREEASAADRPEFDAGCYLCPGNRRANGEENPQYTKTFVFTNDFAALVPDADPPVREEHPLFRSESESGTCRVICFSPRHDLTLAEMEPAGILDVIETWAAQVRELGRAHRWVQVFENKGEIMGCSNPHPHGQVWAGDALPNVPALEHAAQREYAARHGTPMLLEYAGLESAGGARVVAENPLWLAVVPFWAVWPFETLVVPRSHRPRFTDLTSDDRAGLAEILKILLVKYDNLFETSFPYTLGWHGAPFDGEDTSPWQVHAHVYPPLLRSATVKKFMVGYEMLAEAQRDITAESAAERLRSLSPVHWKRSPFPASSGKPQP
jgi:UDPglucose--hexose-1-phosphate uridylyltransferase